MPTNDIGARPLSEPQWPNGGFVLTRTLDNQYDVDVWGFPIANNPVNQWVRGDIVKRYQPEFHPSPLGLFAYDPTDPTTWHQPQI